MFLIGDDECPLIYARTVNYWWRTDSTRNGTCTRASLRDIFAAVSLHPERLVILNLLHHQISRPFSPPYYKGSPDSALCIQSASPPSNNGSKEEIAPAKEHPLPKRRGLETCKGLTGQGAGEGSGSQTWLLDSFSQSGYHCGMLPLQWSTATRTVIFATV